jgi:hypothetical protein
MRFVTCKRFAVAMLSLFNTMCTDNSPASRAAPERPPVTTPLELQTYETCLASCNAWDARQTASCPQTRGADTDCQGAHKARVVQCSALTTEECKLGELRERFEAVPQTCRPGSEWRTRCVGDAIVADCEDGSTRVSKCSASQCKGATPHLIGCRIDADDQAFCECGCEDSAATCAGEAVKFCAAGEWVTSACAQQDCDEAGFGRSLGCKQQTSGDYGCTCTMCKPGSTKDCVCANGLSGTAKCDSSGQKYGTCACTPAVGTTCVGDVCLEDKTLGACQAGKLVALDCYDACKDGGFDGVTACGTGSSGQDVCLCRTCKDPCECSPYASGYACGSNLSPKPPPDNLYLCDQHKTVSTAPCAEGCHAGALGTPDYCENSESNPCENIMFNGPACGANLAVPLTGSALQTLYTCQAGTTVSATFCPNGCNAQPVGSADTCN